MSVKTDNEHYKRVERYAKAIQNLYFDVADDCAKLTTYHSFESGIFTLKDYPVLNKKVDKLIEEMRKSIFATIRSATSKEWNKANENNDELLKHLSKTVKIPQKKYQTRNLKALEAFQNRKIQGLNLSERVWNYSKQYKTEIEQALDVGIADGRSAAQLSRDLREYLREPEKLFRRVRDKNGNLKPSKNALKYNPGGGVYRSSYKNAMRLTRTEINMSYREADHLRWQEMDFVVGIEIRRSNHEYGCPVCESLKGKYPKDFKFSGWHPHCRCHAIPILATEEELLDSIENDTPINSKNEVKEVPEQFTKWAKENKDRLNGAKAKPLWVKDNEKHIEGSVADKKVEEKKVVEIPAVEEEELNWDWVEENSDYLREIIYNDEEFDGTALEVFDQLREEGYELAADTLQSWLEGCKLYYKDADLPNMKEMRALFEQMAEMEGVQDTLYRGVYLGDDIGDFFDQEDYFRSKIGKEINLHDGYESGYTEKYPAFSATRNRNIAKNSYAQITDEGSGILFEIQGDKLGLDMTRFNYQEEEVLISAMKNYKVISVEDITPDHDEDDDEEPFNMLKVVLRQIF